LSYYKESLKRSDMVRVTVLRPFAGAQGNNHSCSVPPYPS